LKKCAWFVLLLPWFVGGLLGVILVVLVSLYTVFVGLVLFLIMKLNDPFQGDISLAPTAFEYLIEALQSEIR
jgi:hypothetical protein